MGRPTAITPEVQATIGALRAPGQSASALHRALTTAGVKIARGTLDSYLRRGAPDALPARLAPATGALERQAEAALATDDLAELHAAKTAVGAALRGWAPVLGIDPRAVRAYAALVAVLKNLTAAVIELTPTPPEARYAPAEAAALAELFVRAEAGARAETGALARLASFDRLLAEGRLLPADD